MSPPTDSLEAALRAVPLLAWTGDVKTVGGDWVGPVTIKTPDYPALAAAVRAWFLQHLREPDVLYSPKWGIVFNDVARRLGL